MKTMITALVAVVAALGSSTSAALPEVVTYAARIENDAGAFNGTLTVTFQLFDASTAGALLWGENVASSVVVDGDLVHDLGSIEPLDDTVLERDSLFLAVTINGDTLEPRVALRAVPYALKALEAERAGDAETLAGLSADDVATDVEVAAAVAARVVTFAQLAGVPAGFADNVDNDTIATAAAGGGLKATANAFSIDNNGVTLARMADSAVGSAEVLDQSLGQADLAPDSVSTSELAAGAVTLTEMALNSVDSFRVVDSSLTAQDLAPNSVGNSELLDNSVTATKISGILVPVFERGDGCGGGLQIGSASCKTVACGTDVDRDQFNVILDVDTIFFDCSGRVCSPAQTSAATCTVSATNDLVGQLVPASF
jgi:hypothetical protein